MSIAAPEMSESATTIRDASTAEAITRSALPTHAIASAIGLLLCVLLAWLFAQTLLHRERVGSTDFLQEWTSARNWTTGRPIYARLSETLPVYFGPGARCVVDLNAHPPTAVVLALPFGQLPYQEAWLWWNVANLAAAGASVWLLLGKRGLGYPVVAWIPFVLLVLSSNALKEQVQLGQLNGWLLLLLTSAWWSDRNERPWMSGACIGIAAAIKLFPGFVVLYFLARRDWKASLSAAGSFAALSLLTTVVLGWETYRDYVLHVLPTLEQFRTAWLNASLHGFWSKVLIGQPEKMVPLVNAPWIAQAAIAASGMVVAGIVAWLASTAKSQQARDIAFAVTTIGMLLVCPITWDHYILLILPAIAILWHASGETRWARLTLLMLAIILLTVRPGWIFGLAIPGPGEFAEMLGLPAPVVLPWQTLTALAYQFYALAALFCLAVIAFTICRTKSNQTVDSCVR